MKQTRKKHRPVFIASKIAGRKVNRVEIPFREYQSRLHCSLRWLART